MRRAVLWSLGALSWWCDALNPCNRICRFNKDFYEGQVCIGCFRTVDEMRTWESLDARARSWTEEDMAERRAEFDGRFAGGASARRPKEDYGGFQRRRKRWAFLLDRDGVINRDVGSPGVLDVRDFELLPGVAEAIEAVKSAGHAVAVVTNQSARRKGLLSRASLDAIHAELRRTTDVDVVLAATGLTDDGSPALKPSPELIAAALDRFRIDPASAVLVGDAATDMAAAHAANVRAAVLVMSSHHGVACEARLEDRSSTAIPGARPGGALDGDARVAGVFDDLPAALRGLLAFVDAEEGDT